MMYISNAPKNIRLKKVKSLSLDAQLTHTEQILRSSKLLYYRDPCIEQIECFNFTLREKETMKLIMLGKTYSQTAVILGISKNTVSEHTQNIYRKLGVHNKATAITTFLRRKC